MEKKSQAASMERKTEVSKGKAVSVEKNAEAGNSFDYLAEVVPGRETWRIKVRVLRMWKVPAFLNPTESNSIEMVLVDEKGAKIHASVRKQLIYLFENKVVEGQVYQMSLFSVGANVGSYRSTLHPYKLIFQMKTKVKLLDDSSITLHGLSLTTISEINNQTQDSDFLVDVIGLMTGISDEREYIRDGKITKMILLELTDESGKIECALFGDYVGELKSMIGRGGYEMPVVVVQYAKIKLFRERVSIQNVMHTTRIMVNPEIPEAYAFKSGLAVQGVETSGQVNPIGLRVRPSLEEEFLRMHTKKTIAQLPGLDDEGLYVVGGVVDGFVDGADWWYPACKCHRSVTADSGSYYCNGCVGHVFQVIPRFKVRVKVSDEGGDGVFVLFDNDVTFILNKSCAKLVASVKGENAGFYPSDLNCLIGKKMLFVVDHSSGAVTRFDGSHRVRRVCMDTRIIEEYYRDLPGVSLPKVVDGLPVSDPVGEAPEGKVNSPVVPKMVPSNLLGKRKLTKADSGDCLDLNQVLEDDRATGSVDTPSELCDSPVSAEKVPLKCMSGSSRAKRNMNKAKQVESFEISDDDDDDEAVPDTQDTEFLKDLIVSPPASDAKPSKFEAARGRLRRNLTKVFEDVAVGESKKRLKPVKIEKE